MTDRECRPGGQGRTEADQLPDALDALASTRARTLAAMDDSRTALESAEGTLDRARKTLRDRHNLAHPEPQAPGSDSAGDGPEAGAEAGEEAGPDAGEEAGTDVGGAGEPGAPAP